MGDNNPFQVMKTDDGDVLRGARQDLGRQEILKIDYDATYIGVCEGAGSHGNAPVVAELSVKWEPAVGSKVQLCEPNRDATVCSVEYVIGLHGRLETRVWLDDPAVTRSPIPFVMSR